MDRDEFVYEMNRYCVSDPELILADQKELYTAEEIQTIEEILEIKSRKIKNPYRRLYSARRFFAW